MIGKTVVELVSGQIVLKYETSTFYRDTEPAQYWIFVLLDAGVATFVSSLAVQTFFSRH
jgi:hypothetical protein